MNIYIPYTYLIGWSEHKKFYYGRRTAKNCKPNDLWNTYFTSSKEVKQFISTNGQPDIIQIRKTFPNNPNACKTWESKALQRLNAQHNPKFLNKKNGDHKWDSTGMITVKDDTGNTFQVLKNDPRYISGELVGIAKGKVTVKDDKGNTFQVLKNDPRYISGELVHVVKGNVVVRDRNGNTMSVSKEDPRYLSGELEHIAKRTFKAKDSTGTIYVITKEDPRWGSGELVGLNKNKKASKESIELRRSKLKGQKRSKETKEKNSKNLKLFWKSENGQKLRELNSKTIWVMNLETKEFYRISMEEFYSNRNIKYVAAFSKLARAYKTKNE